MHLLSTVTLALGVISLPALALPTSSIESDLAAIAAAYANTREGQTDTLLFGTSMDGFLSAKRAQTPAGLDWTDDGCTVVEDQPLTFDFNPSCKRHDFGYRNYGAQGRCSDADRSRIDKNFLKDMENQCDKEISGTLNVFKRNACKALAGTYWAGVRVLAASHFC